MEMQGAKVVWDKVFLPKDEGGLGVKDFYTWNLSCNMKLIWLLFQKAGSLWIAWLNNYMSTFFWFNNWTDRSPLFVEGSLYDIPCDAKLADALNNFVLTNIREIWRSFRVRIFRGKGFGKPYIVLLKLVNWKSKDSSRDCQGLPEEASFCLRCVRALSEGFFNETLVDLTKINA
ncbi:hypothetical protein CRG98_022695 [Punica granatum]|uniref:Reverse transcriptase zinc-binding domain-containing protein n=1 Tax=Punica granatum TaxID=22663 RepID=A0A2I0JKX5_PUNGR|nr:hypothetical protein CRG98_022695 [Punica granatum]